MTERFVSPDEIRARFSRAMSRMYREEVPAYGAFVADQVARLGRNNPMVRTQFYSEEIDQDGGMFPGEESSIWMYDEVAGAYYYRPQASVFPPRYLLTDVLDLNGDGRMEIVLSVGGKDQLGAIAFEIDGAAPRLVLTVRCPE